MKGLFWCFFIIVIKTWATSAAYGHGVFGVRKATPQTMPPSYPLNKPTAIRILYIDPSSRPTMVLLDQAEVLHLLPSQYPPYQGRIRGCLYNLAPRISIALLQWLSPSEHLGRVFVLL